VLENGWLATVFRTVVMGYVVDFIGVGKSLLNRYTL